MALIQVKRGLASALAVATLSSGELGYTTDTKSLYVGDGVTVGALKIAMENAAATFTNVLSPSLQAKSSAGISLKNQSGATCILAGAGGGQGVSTLDGLTVGGALTATAGAVSLGATTVDGGSGALPALIVATTSLRLAGGDGLGIGIQGDAFAGTGLTLYGRAAEGTRASPSATAVGRVLCNVLGYGHNGTSLTTIPAARYQIRVRNTWTGSDNSTYHDWWGTPAGSTTAAEWMRLIDAGLAIGATALSGPERVRISSGGTPGTPLAGDTLIGNGVVATAGSYRVGANQVVGSRSTGWSAATGTATRTTFATGSVTTAQLAERLKALIDDLITHGLIGT